MSSDPTPSSNSAARPYGENRPAVSGAGLAGTQFNPKDETIFLGIVTDVSSNCHSCTVTIPRKTAGHGIPCLWGSPAINRWGGAADFNPPEIGSVVLVHEFVGANYGVILAQVPGLINKPTEDWKTNIDAFDAISSFNEDTGQIMEALSMGGSALSGHQRLPQDIFPGERGIRNEYGIAIAVLRTMAVMKASEICKIEAFLLDDLLRICGHNLDVFTSMGEETIRELASGGIIYEKSTTTNSGESRGGETKFGQWRHKILGGVVGDIIREYVMHPGASDDAPDRGLSETVKDSTGLLVDRTISGGGIIKARSIGVPKKLVEANSIELSDREPPETAKEDLADFEWPKEPIDPTAAIRDAMAWIMNRQANARSIGLEEVVESWKINTDDPEESGAVNPSALGGDVGIGQYLRDKGIEVDLITLDPNPDNGKARMIQVNDAWILVLPDGTISIRDGSASSISMHRGNINFSASKDLNFLAGRNIVMKSGHDTVVNALRGLDLTAGKEQVRLWGKKSVFVHSEVGGIMLSTNTAGGVSGGVGKLGEEFNSAGIIFKTPGSVIFHTPSEYHYLQTQFFVGGQRSKSTHKPDFWPLFTTEADYYVMKSLNDFLFRSGDQGDGHQVRILGSGDVSFKTTGTIETEKDLFAFMGKLYSSMTKEELIPIPPGHGWTSLYDTDKPLFDNAPATGEKSRTLRNEARGKIPVSPDGSPVISPEGYDWSNYRSGYFVHEQLKKMEFSMRTEAQYGTISEDFGWTEQPWQREWSAAVPWGRDEVTVGPSSGQKTWVYPGKRYWDGNAGIWSYSEVNVSRTGNVKGYEDLSKSSGQVARKSFASMLRHPD